MFQVVIGAIAIFAGLTLFLARRSSQAPVRSGRISKLTGMFRGKAFGVVLVLFGMFLLASTSFVNIDANRVGHLKRIYFGSELPSGRIIALPGQKGPQARILGPGFHIEPLINVLYSVEQLPVITIEEGEYGEVVALDGKAMPGNMYIAPKIADDRVAQMLDAETFLTEGGYRGPQETVLKPGSYRLNQYLFKINRDRANTRATLIPAGHVGVVKSNVMEPGTVCVEKEVKAAADGREIRGALSVPLVPRGCVGIWREPLFPGAYYLNRKAYQITLVDTRVQTWLYKGGYTRRTLELTIDEQGVIKQRERTSEQRVPKNAADQAVFVKVEGWDIPLELRALVQIKPENAPVVVGSVGNLSAVEDRILTPAIRSIVRNVAGSVISIPVKADDGSVTYVLRPTRVLDLIDNRDNLERSIEEKIKVEGRKAGVDIKEIRIGEPALPPELLFSRKREQLADQLSKAYERETAAQIKRTEREQARATADEQPRLVAAQIAVQVAEQREAERAALGSAERKFLEQIALGQQAQANVLGQDRVAMLQALEKLLASLERKPELVQLISRLVPHTVVGTNGMGLAGAAAILGTALNPQQQPSSQ